MKSELYVIVYICSLYIFFTAAQIGLEIEGDNPLKLTGGTNPVITCKVVSGSSSQDYDLKWYDQRGIQIVTGNRLELIEEDTKLKLAINNVVEDDGGMYNCTGKIDGRLESAHVEVKINIPVEVTAPLIQKFANGTTAQVICVTTGSASTYWYYPNGTKIKSTDPRVSISSSYLEIQEILTTDEGYYLCKAVGPFDFVNSNISVIVTVPPKITRPPTGQSIAVGEPARFECVATAKPPPFYLWYKDGGSDELRGERYNISDNGVFIIKSVTRDDKGMYKCRANSENKMDEAEAELRVLVPPSIVKLDNTTGDEGAGATIRCTASGEPIPRIKWQKKGDANDFSEGAQIDQSRIVVSHQQRPDRMEVEGRLDISNLKSSDAGFYICKAENEARIVEKSSYLSVQYKPNFSKVKEDVLYSWAGTSTTITCIASSVPSANITWEKEGQAIIQGNRYQMSSVTIGEDTTGRLSFSVDWSNEAEIYGIYTCKAFNTIGESLKNFTLRKADPPITPSASIKSGATPISLTLVINVPSAKPPVEEIIVNFANRQPITVRITTQKTVEVLADKLSPSTPYTFRITAKSEVGSSPEYPLQYTTMAPQEPGKVEFAESSKIYGDKPLEYTLTWKTINNGGRPITNIKLRYREVEVFPNKSQSNEFQFKREISGYKLLKPAVDATSAKITGLLPSRYYQVEIVAENIEGSSAPSSMIFLTNKDEPVTTAGPEGTKTKDPSKKSQDTNTGDSIPLGLIIAIIIIVVIVIFIVIDVTCYYKRKCGVFMCIKEKVGRTGSMETRSKEKIIEEGDADGEKKVPLLADNKDTEGTDADAEQEVGETAPSDEKEPEDKEEKPETPEPEKEVEEAEEAKPEDQEKSSPKEEVKIEPGEKKEGE